MTPDLDAGPLLTQLAEAQQAERVAMSPGTFVAYAKSVIRICGDIGDPVVYPVGVSGERLAGAACVLAKRGLNIWDRHSRLDQRTVMVLAVADVSGFALRAAAAQARRLGATRIHGCGVAVSGEAELDGLDSYRPLRPVLVQRRSA